MTTAERSKLTILYLKPELAECAYLRGGGCSKLTILYLKQETLFHLIPLRFVLNLQYFI